MIRAIGTVLPNAASVASTKRYAARVAKLQDRVAAENLSGLTRRSVGGEDRYYDASGDRYAVVSRSGVVRWFRVTASGDFAIVANG